MKVSIIIPAYNAEKYIKRAIDSVRAQTYPYWECIIVDDGSTDDTALTVTKETFKSENFHLWCFEENHGVAWARNFGIEKADGDAIFFLDADDWMEPGCLAYLALLAKMMPQVGRIVSQPIVHWPGGSFSRWRMRPFGIHPPLSEHLFKGSSCDVGHVTGCLYICDRIPHIMFPDVPIFEDLLFNMRLIISGVSLFIAIKPAYNYLRHSDSISYGTLTIEDARKVLEEYHKMIIETKPDSSIVGRFDNFINNLIKAKLGDKYEDL